MNVAFLGGGTGGHLAPGIGIAEELVDLGHEVLFHVAGRGIERSMLEPRGLRFVNLFGEGGRPSLRRAGMWFEATRRWRASLREFQPDVIVVLGGWVALPAAWSGFGGHPTLLVETNARPGRVQRLLSRRVDVACLAVDGPRMPRGRRLTEVVGIPAPRIERRGRDEAVRRLGLDPERRCLLVLGGSQGASDLNALVPAVRRVLATRERRWQVLHVTGPARLGCRDEPLDPPARDVPVHELRFCDDMASAWAAADAAVCRSGAGTVAELALSATPAVLVPYPHHADRHQAANGVLLAERGAAVTVGAQDPTGQQSVPALLAQVLDRLPIMSEAARAAARPDAAARVARLVVALATGRLKASPRVGPSEPDGEALAAPAGAEREG
ncbi:MAG: UDP-N-acetylglucosamine--N-acetylmuramyl-(pentapeptide) pyrophosphoryl-undecaprenol N-acetylglucosamine transferase [Planctomycetes bacterium]|nr:UDP-N-acetylglucosamine--N-acetylmuramyl-(pentapeptide) pyrophosphoryl-undecaprenol N-acetylglucosamine transferase [Planctomycetota bacterium]